MPDDRRELSAWLQDGAPLRAASADLERWHGAVSLLLTAANEFRKRLTKNEGFPPQCADTPAMRDLLEELGRDSRALRVLVEIRALPAPAYSDAQWERVREVAQVLVLAAAELDPVFREQGAADFPAVSLAALRALGSAEAPTDLGLRLDYRLQHILVDEFQDTSSAQLELVRLLTAGWQRGDGRSVFCVGDPMQSIYGFRQAEVRAFLELAEEGIGELRFDVQRLHDNFRSARAVGELGQRLLCAHSAAARRSRSRRHRVSPQRSGDFRIGRIAGGGSRGCTARLRDPRRGVGGHRRHGRGGGRTGIPSGGSRCWCAHERTREKSPPRCATRGVAFHAVEIEPLHDRSTVRDIITLTCALLHLGDRTSWLAVSARAVGRAFPGRPVADLARGAVGLGRAGRRGRPCSS